MRRPIGLPAFDAEDAMQTAALTALEGGHSDNAVWAAINREKRKVRRHEAAEPSAPADTTPDAVDLIKRLGLPADVETKALTALQDGVFPGPLVQQLRAAGKRLTPSEYL